MRQPQHIDYNADNDVRSTNNDDNNGYCDILSTLTSNAENDVRSKNNDGNTDYCDNLSTLTTMQTTALEAPTTMTTLATATTSAY